MISLISLVGTAVTRGSPIAAFLSLDLAAVIVMPVLYGILGFFSGILSALVFNLAASWPPRSSVASRSS